MAITINGSGITSSEIADGTITNADINASAGIVASKLSGAGKVLQVVNNTHSSTMTTTSTTYADTGISATITPFSSSNNILILVTAPLRKHNSSHGDTAGHIKIIRGSTDVQEFGRYMAWNGISNVYAQESVSFCFKDSNANTTSATTYKVQLKASSSGNGVECCHNAAQASITLMEIGA